MGCGCSTSGSLRVVVPLTPENADSFQHQVASALERDWSRFDWVRDCHIVHEGSMKVVGHLKSHPGIALVSVLSGTGEDLIQKEISTLSKLASEGIRVVGYAGEILDVPCYDASTQAMAKGYLVQYFTDDAAFVYEEGEVGTDDYVLEKMRKLRILYGDEGDWVMNRDTIRVLKENKLEKQFMEDLTAYANWLLLKNVRIVDFQGVLGKDGHFYVADPLDIQPIETKVNRHLLEGVFMNSTNPKRENKPRRAAFVDELGIELGVVVPDEE